MYTLEPLKGKNETEHPLGNKTHCHRMHKT